MIKVIKKIKKDHWKIHLVQQTLFERKTNKNKKFDLYWTKV